MDRQKEVYDFLDKIRESGKVNMMDERGVHHIWHLLEEKFEYAPEECKTAYWEWTQAMQRG